MPSPLFGGEGGGGWYVVRGHVFRHVQLKKINVTDELSHTHTHTRRVSARR